MLEMMSECGRSLSEEDIGSVERQLGLKLPTHYRDFLMQYNGGRPTPRAYPIEGLANNPFGVVQVFFGFDLDEETSNLTWIYECFQGRISANLLPIACDDGGNLICLSLWGDDAGAVVYWDHENESSEPSYDNVCRIAGSFHEFLDGLREFPEYTAS